VNSEPVNVYVFPTKKEISNQSMDIELRGLAPIGVLEPWSIGVMGSKRHSAKGRGQRVKNFYAMRYALCALLIFIPGARQYATASKNSNNFSKL